MKKGIILGTVGLALIGGVVYGIKKIAEPNKLNKISKQINHNF